MAEIRIPEDPPVPLDVPLAVDPLLKKKIGHSPVFRIFRRKKG